MSKPMPTDRRDTLVWQNADDAVGVANMLNVQDQDGRNVIARMISEGHTGELKAASYNGSGGGSVTPDPSGDLATDHVAHERGIRDDETGKRIGQPDAANTARVNLLEVDDLLQEISRKYGRISRLLSGYMPRVPKLSEVEQTNLEDANADPGCESCSRITTTGGQRLWSKTWRTGRVSSKPKNTEGQKRDKGRARRALLTSTDDETEALARLCVEYRLCRGCYEHVLHNVSPGAGLTIGQAYRLSHLRERLSRAVAS